MLQFLYEASAAHLAFGGIQLAVVGYLGIYALAEESWCSGLKKCLYFCIRLRTDRDAVDCFDDVGLVRIGRRSERHCFSVL